MKYAVKYLVGQVKPADAKDKEYRKVFGWVGEGVPRGSVASVNEDERALFKTREEAEQVAKAWPQAEVVEVPGEKK